MDDAYDGPVDLGTPTEDFEAGAKKPKILMESYSVMTSMTRNALNPK
jgi:hypothetical protein